MAQIFNGQRVRGVRVLDEGATLFNMMQVRGVRAADEDVMFAGGLQAMGVDVLDADRVIYNDQLVMGVVVITDDRALYNGLEILPAWALTGSLGGNILPDVLPAGRMWVGQYDANSVTVTASGVNNVEQMRFAAVPVSGGAAIVSAPIAVDATYDFARTTLTGLAAGTEYDIEIRSVAGNPSGDQGWVKTRPAAREAFKIGFASCFRVGNDYAIFDTIIDQNPGMLAFYNTGDRGYADIATNNVALYHAADDNIMAMTRVSRLHRTLPHLYIWDDHDYGPNDSAANSPSRAAAVSWFRSRVPVRPALTGASDAPYYLHSPMPGVTVAVLDVRSERDFGNGRMISAAQEAWLIAAIEAVEPGDAFIIQSGVPWIASSGSDMWFSAAAQRQRIADAVTANCPGQVMITAGDMHALAWDTGSNSVGGIPVAHAAPLGNAISTKGGPYSVGPITATESQYGTLTFTPISGGWTVRFEGWSVDAAGVQTRRIDATVVLEAPEVTTPVDQTAAYRTAVLDTSPQFLLLTPSGAAIPDETGNGRAGTIVGTQGSHIADGPFGLPVFRGTDTCHVRVDHDAAFNGTSWSVGFFFNPNATATNQQGYFHRGSDQKLSRVSAGTIEVRASALNTEVINSPLNSTAWNYVVITFDADTGTARLYSAADGGDIALRHTRIVASSLHSTTDPILFNGRQVGDTVDRRGTSAHAGMARWNRALSEAEIVDIYGQARGGEAPPVEPDPVYEWTPVVPTDGGPQGASAAFFRGIVTADGANYRVTTAADSTNGRAAYALPSVGTVLTMETSLAYGDATRIICRQVQNNDSVGGTTIFDVNRPAPGAVLTRTDTFTVASGNTLLHFIGVTAAGQFFTINAATRIRVGA